VPLLRRIAAARRKARAAARENVDFVKRTRPRPRQPRPPAFDFGRDAQSY